MKNRRATTAGSSKMSLRMRILGPTGLLVILVLGLIAGLTYVFTKDALHHSTTEGLEQLAQSKAELIDLWVEDVKGLMRVSAERNVYQAVLKDDNEQTRKKAIEELQDQVKNLAGFSYINIANAAGEVRASSIPDSVGKIKVPDREYFQKAMKGQVNVSTVYLARTTGKPAFSVAAPLKDGDKVLGVIFAVPDLGWFSEKFVEPTKVADTGHMSLFDRAGVVFAHKDRSLIMKLKLEEQDWGRLWLQRKKGLVSFVDQGQQRLAMLETCRAVDWTVALSAPTSEVFDQANRITVMNLALALGGAILILAVLVFLVRSVVTPITRIIGQLNEGSHQVAAAADQVNNASQRLAEGSSQQAASLEETTASLEEITSMVKQNADNAAQANGLAQETNQVMGRADQAMGDLTRAMEEISAAGEQTGKIIKTIDEIAFQTNLLALNAAVEAARAGEAGAGFAVVAEEVRNLAQRAAEAAKNTASLIEGTIKKTKEGADLVSRTAEAFHEVRGKAGKVGELVGEIAAASSEQAQGVGQISQAMNQVDKVTQEIAANAEESASASEELNAQAGVMRGVVGDLQGLVQGQGGRGKRESRPKGRPAQPVRGKEQPATLPAPRSAKGARQVGQTRPQDVIPLDDDFRDF